MGRVGSRRGGCEDRKGGPYEDQEDAEEEADDARGALPPREEADGALEPDDEDEPRQEEEVAWGGWGFVRMGGGSGGWLIDGSGSVGRSEGWGGSGWGTHVRSHTQAGTPARTHAPMAMSVESRRKSTPREMKRKLRPSRPMPIFLLSSNMMAARGVAGEVVVESEVGGKSQVPLAVRCGVAGAV